ncbi:MAG TPA: hypothetical protein VK136_05710 [Bacillota bacterium]|nr:hypothetical protein [Bacillota bacterium]
MPVLHFAAGRYLYKLWMHGGEWQLLEKSVPHPFLALAVDPHRKERMYAGTFDNGLWMSDDEGETWRQAGSGIAHDRVISVSVSPTEEKSGYGVVWAGTEPSGLFRSEDGGQTWTDCPALLDLPSKDTWSFPPRPYTHHVQWIQPDRHDEGRIFVGIELGGVMKSVDKGRHWEDRKPHSQFDCHTLTMHDQAPGRIYEAAGGGYAESKDGGKTWETQNEGLGAYTYLVSIAVDPADPDTIVASAAKSARTAYNPEMAKTVIVRRQKNEPWQMVRTGLPDPNGASVFSLGTHVSEPGVFYAVNNIGAYRSVDAGKTWKRLPVDWPDHLKNKRIRGLVVI